MAAEVPGPGSAEAGLPEKIETADLEALNQALAVLLGRLRLARLLPRGDTSGRPGAVVALHAAWDFLLLFEPVLAERLHVPLMTLQSALLALNENNIEPILKPTKRKGRATSSPRRYGLIGIAVGTAKRLEWAGLSPPDANKAVASKLKALGIKPTRGGGSVTADTVRRWREQIDGTQALVRSLPELLLSMPLSAEDSGWVNAALNAETMVTEKWREKITALAPADARRFVLLALEKAISEMTLTDPASPPI
jgi:hypothetical protein